MGRALWSASAVSRRVIRRVPRSRSPYYRADVVAALRAEVRRRADAERAEQETAEREAALYRRQLAAARNAASPLEFAKAVVALGKWCEPAMAWEAWHTVKVTGSVPPTHHLVRVKIQTPLRGPRFKELDRRPAWREADGTRYVDDEDQVWSPQGSQPVRGPSERRFPVDPGAPLQATVMSARSTGRFTMISANPVVRVDADAHWGAALGALKRVVFKESG